MSIPTFEAIRLDSLQLPFSDREANDHAFEAERGLIIRDPWAEMILSGTKTWEIRGSLTRFRGKIGIIKAGSKAVFGYCDLVDSRGPLSLDDLLKTTNLHRISTTELEAAGLPYKATFAWVFADARRLQRPQPYEHHSGAIIWVRLPVLSTQNASSAECNATRSEEQTSIGVS